MNHSLQTFALAMLVLILGYFVVRAVYRMAIFGATAEYRKTVLDASWLLEDKHHLNDLEARIVSVSILALYDYRYKTSLMKFGLDKKLSEPMPADLPVRPAVDAVARAFAQLAMFENPVLTLRLLKRQITISNGKKAAKTASTAERSVTTVAGSLPFVEKKRHHGDPLPC